MLNTREELGKLVRSHRDQRGFSQEQLATQCGSGVNRSIVAHLEQGLRIPKPELLELICRKLEIPTTFWQPFTDSDSLQRFQFEDTLGELVGYALSLDGHDDSIHIPAEAQIKKLFEQSLSNAQTLALFNSICIFYGIQPITSEFFDRYFGADVFSSLEAFDKAIQGYQEEAVRLFSTLQEAFKALNSGVGFNLLLNPLKERDLNAYYDRAEWDTIEPIPEERLPDLGYISATRVRQENTERSALKVFLTELAAKLRVEGSTALVAISTRQRNRMDTLLRKFQSNLRHGLFSPLFAPDPDELVREASRIAPKTETELSQMAQTQSIALRNLARYLTADHIDVYVATSMRSDADFISVNHFVRYLFAHHKVRPLKLRYFNPTQSWIDDRIAKGLVEALMLRRADITIYMAQKTDTFGKDSEASVALGQGKPVIVYVPKLKISDGVIDTQELFQKSTGELLKIARDEMDPESEEVDETVDRHGLMSRILNSRLAKTIDSALIEAVASHWADFDLYNEADRIKEEQRADYRKWLDAVISNNATTIPSSIRAEIIGILVAISIRFEERASLFREIHPLALQVILSSGGVLNGILVVRSIEECGEILHCLIKNKLQLKLSRDEQNYRIVESITGSTVRVISRHKLLRNAFEIFYSRMRAEII